MKLRIIAASLIFAAASALAAPLSQTTVTLTGVNGASTGGYYSSPYYLTIGNQVGVSAYCDDALDPSSIGQTWHANVFSGADLTGTYFSTSDPNYVADYAKIFWLVDASASGAVDAVTAQQSIWQIEDPNYVGSTASIALLANAGQETDLSRFTVIDQDPNPANPGANPNAPTPRAQEFVVEAQAPEPATMALIGAGLIAIAFRKRKVSGQY